MRTLIIYATKYGTTKIAAEKLKDKLLGEVVLCNIIDEKVPSLDDYENVIIGGSIYMGKLQKKLTGYVVNNINALLKKRVGLFICAAENASPKGIKELQESFPEDIYNKALSKEVFGCGFNFEKMGFLEKKIVGSIMGVKSSICNINDEVIENFAKTMNFSGSSQSPLI